MDRAVAMIGPSTPRENGHDDAGSRVPSPSAADEAESAAREVFGDRFPAIEHYRDLLANEGVAWGLLGPREADRIWERHILNSAALADLVPEGSDVIDVGSGAGLPGIPLAVLRPDLDVTLLELLLRRVNFLALAVEDLGIGDRVGVERGRAEDHEGAFDVVTCRAVANLSKLLPWVVPLMGARGEVLALKGSGARDEVTRATKFLVKNRLRTDVIEVRAHPRVEVTTVVRVRRAQPRE